MEIRVFNLNKIPVSIRFRDIFNVKLLNRRIYYFTIHGIFHGASNLREQTMLYENQGLVQIEKNSVINVNHIEHMIKGNAYIRGKKYPIARRRRTKVTRMWRIRQTRTD